VTEPAATFHVVAQPHPLRAEVVHADVACGCSLRDLGAGGAVLAWVDGERVDDAGYVPRDGQKVVLRAVAQGDGKDPLRLAATLALAAYAPVLGAGVAGATSGVAFNLATAAVSVVGNLAINALIPPSSQNLDALNGSKPFRGLPSTRNELRPFGVIPRLYGTHRVFPALAARPYSEQVGADTYLRMLFCLGYGPLQIDGLTAGLHRAAGEDETPTVPATLRIGETALNDYADWSLEWLPGGDADPPLTLFSRNVVETALNDLFDEDGEAVVRTVTSAGQITLDFHAPAMVRFAPTGKSRPVSVALKIEIRLAGSADPWQEVTPQDVESPGAVPATVSGTTRSGYSGNWPWLDGESPNGETVFGRAASGSSDIRAFYLSGSEVKPQTLGVTITPPSSGAWDVRVTRLHVLSITQAPAGPYFVYDPTGVDEFFADFTWTAIRGIGADIAQTVPPGLAFMALRIRVTDQLAGGIDTFSCVASALIPVPDGEGGWELAVSSNPAWVYRDVLTGSANARPLADSRINDTILASWAAENAAEAREFNAVFDGRTTVFEALKNVASTGRASPSVRDGTFAVVEDRPGAVPVQLFTDRNSWDFSASKAFTKQPHALRVKFKARDADWQDSERIVYADGYSKDGTNCLNPGPGGSCQTATEFEQMVLFGVTDKDAVFRDGRYFQAVAILRPETASWTADIEHLVARRGDVVRRSADVMLLGLGAARIKAINGDTIDIDEQLVVAFGKNYQARFRRADGTQALASITNTVGTWTTLEFLELPAGVQVGDLVALGESGLVTQDWLITAVEPQQDLQARITAVPYSPAVFDAETGTIPPYDPLVTIPDTVPPEPVIISVAAGGDAALQADTGARTYRIIVGYVFPASNVAVTSIEAALLRDGEARWEAWPPAKNSGRYTFTVTDGASGYRVRIRGVSQTGTPGPWAEAVVPGDAFTGELQGLALQEQRNTPSTPNGDLSTVIATVTPPEDPSGYSHAIVEYHRDGLVGWLRGGVTDADGQVRVILPANGLMYEFRARAVSTTGVEDPDGPRETITLSDASAPAPDPDAGAPTSAALNVTNLRIEGEAPSETEWSGRDVAMAWDAVAGASDYRVRIFSTGGSPQFLRLVYVTVPRLDYSFVQNALDCAAAGLSGPQRELRFEVIARNIKGVISATPAEKTVLNPPPELPGDFTVTAFFSAIELMFSRPTDADFAGVSVHMSETNGFVPDASNLVYTGDTTVPVVIQNLEGGGTRYLRVVLRDDFGPGTPSLQYSATLQELPWEDDTPPTAPTGLVLTSQVQETDLSVTAALVAEWDAATDNSGKLFYEVEYWVDEDLVIADTRDDTGEEVYALAMFTGSTAAVMAYGDDGAGDAIAGGLFRDSVVGTSYTVFPAQIGKRYKFRVRAVDYSGNTSDWAGPVEHTIVGDTVPPGVPTGGTATGGIDKITVRWVNPADNDWLQTRVHRGSTSEFTPSDANRLATTRADVFVDAGVAADTSYYYKLVALDVSGNASAPTAAIGPAQSVKFSSTNISQFMAPGAIGSTQISESFTSRVDQAEATIAVHQAEIESLLSLLDAPEFDSGNDYLEDDLVAYDGKLYRATQNQTAPSVAPPDASYWQLVGDFTSLGEAVAANSAAISLLQTDVTSLAGTVTAQASDITVLQTGLSDANNNIDANATAISSLSTTVASHDGTLSSHTASITALNTSVSNLDDQVEANTSAITVLETTVEELEGFDVAAVAQRLTVLESDITVPVFALQGADGGAFVLAFGDDGAGDAVAAGSRTATSEAIETLRVTSFQQGDTLVSQGSAITALQSGLTTTQANVTANASAISGIQTTVTAQGSTITALSASLTELETTVGDNTATITQQAASIDGIEANWSVRVNVNGRVTGVGLIAGGTESIFGVMVDRFVVIDPANNSTAPAPFEVAGGAVYIKTAFIRNLDAGQITTGTLAADRVGANTITANKLNVSQLSSISANLGTMTAGTITGALVRTAASGARAEMSTANGLRTINSGGTTTAQLHVDGSGFLGVGGSAISWNTAGVVTVPGTLIAGDIVGNTFKTGTTGWRVEIGPSLTGDTVLRYTNGTQTRLSLDQLGNLSLTGTLTGSIITGSTIRTSGDTARVEMTAASGLASINASGNLTAHLRPDGSGFLGQYDYGGGGIAWTTAGALSFRTAGSGQRLEVGAGGSDSAKYFDSAGNEISRVGQRGVQLPGPGKSLIIVEAILSGGTRFVGQQASSWVGVAGLSYSGFGVVGHSATGRGVVGTGTVGVYGETSISGQGVGVEGIGWAGGRFSRDSAGAGGNIQLVPAGTSAPTWTAEAGCIATVTVGGVAQLYFCRGGNTWVRLD
jgi:hypothetical protein